MEALKSMPENSKRDFTQFEFTKKIITSLQQFKISPAAKLVLILLSTHYNSSNGNVVFPSMPFIADTLGISLSTTKQAIKDLINAGLIIKTKREKITGNHNKYAFTNKLEKPTFKQPKNNFLKGQFSDFSCIEQINEQIKKQSLIREEEKKPIELKITGPENNFTNEQQLTESEQRENKNNSVSLEDFTLLKQFAISKQAKNPTAYAKTLVNNGSYIRILEEIKQKKQAWERAEKQIKETKELIESYKRNRTFEPIPEEIKLKAEMLKKQIAAKKQNSGL